MSAAGVQTRSFKLRPTAASEPERAEPVRVAGDAQSDAGADDVPDVRGRGRGGGAPEVREAPDEAPASAVAEQDEVAAAAHQSHVGNRLGAHRQGGHVRRGHRVIRDPVPRGRRPGNGRAQSADRPPAKRRALREYDLI